MKVNNVFQPSPVLLYCSRSITCYFMNIRSERNTYLSPFKTGEPSCSKQS